MKLDLNLAREGGQARRPWWAAAWAAGLVLVVAATVANGWYHRSLSAAMGPAEGRLRTLEATVKRLEAQQAVGLPTGTREALTALPGRVDAYNQILVAAAFPWTGLLMELEAALPERVGLTAILPDPTTGTVTIVGAAKSFEDVAAFVHQLEERAAFRDVILLRHSEQARSGSPPLVQHEFSIRLHYAMTGRKTPAGA